MGFPKHLLDALLHRDDAEIETQIAAVARDEGIDAAYRVTLQFAVLAFAPSEHSRSVIAGLDALKTLDLEPSTRLRQVTHLARYAAAARRPWSEAPITTPPPATPADGERSSLSRALKERDRLRAERWLAARLMEGDGVHELFVVSCSIRHVMPEALILTAAAARIVAAVPPPHRFGVLRIVTAQWAAESFDLDQDHPARRPLPPFAREHADYLIAKYEAEKGSPLAMQRIALLDAELCAREESGGADLLDNVASVPIQVSDDAAGDDNVEFPDNEPQQNFSNVLSAWAIAARRADHWNRDSLATMKKVAAESAMSRRWNEEWSNT